MFTSIKMGDAGGFIQENELVFEEQTDLLPDDDTMVIIGWHPETKEVYFFKKVAEVSIHDCKSLGLEPFNWCFYPSVWRHDFVVFLVGGTESKFEFNFDHFFSSDYIEVVGAPYLASTIKKLYPDLYRMWDNYNESVSHLQ